MAQEWKLDERKFGPLWKYVQDEKVTDIDWDGDALWVEYSDGRKINPEEEEITPHFVENFTQYVANHEARQFNATENILQAETDTVRITCANESIATSGRCFSIRKSMPTLRFTAMEALKDGYCSKELMAFLINCVVVKSNFAFVGEPGHGKTECAKFLSTFIDKTDRVLTVEDALEWHYKHINPGKRCIELKVSENSDYSKCIKLALRFTPSWLMLSEARSSEVQYLVQGWSTGVHGMTTLHTNDVRNIPSRCGNMMDTINDGERIKNNVYSYLDLGILMKKEKDKRGITHRRIKQVGIFTDDNNRNKCTIVYDDEGFHIDRIPKSFIKKMNDAGVYDITKSKEMDERIRNELRGIYYGRGKLNNEFEEEVNKFDELEENSTMEEIDNLLNVG